VYFPILVERAKLHPRDDADTELISRITRRADTIDGVVIGERERGQAATRRCLYYLLWRECAVRGCRVRMQVDESRPARLAAHFA
jgi:hypothetical protein